MTFAAWRTLVKLAYQGGEPSHASLVRAVTDGARAVLVRDIESDLTLAKSYRESFLQAKIKYAGTRFTDAESSVVTEVKTLMPIDSDTAAALPLVNNAIVAALEELNALSDKWDAYLLQAAIDLQRHVPFYQVRQVTTYLYDSAGVVQHAFASQIALPEGARIQQLTYGLYFPALEQDIEYEAGDRVMSNGRVYEVVTVDGVLTAYEVGAGLTSIDGNSESLGALTFTYYSPAQDWPVRQLDWSNRNRLLTGGFNAGPAYAFPPQADILLLYPALNSKNRFDLEWVGVAEAFGDSDEVLFDRTAAEAAAHYIRMMLYQTEVDDTRQSAASLIFYQKAVRKAIIDTQDRELGSPAQIQPYDYRRRCLAWGSAYVPLAIGTDPENPDEDDMATNGFLAYTNGSGTTTVTPSANNFTGQITFSGSAGARVISIAKTGRVAGDRLTLVCLLPATEGLALDFTNGPGGDSLLAAPRFEDGTYYTDGLTLQATFEFYFDGTDWNYQSSTIPA